MSKRNQVSGVLCSRIKSGRIYFVRRKKIFRSPPPMLAMREGNAGNGAYLQEKLDYVEQIVRDLTLAIIPSLGERASAWKITHRVCDSYCLPKAVLVRWIAELAQSASISGSLCLYSNFTSTGTRSAAD